MKNSIIKGLLIFTAIFMLAFICIPSFATSTKNTIGKSGIGISSKKIDHHITSREEIQKIIEERAAENKKRIAQITTKQGEFNEFRQQLSEMRVEMLNNRKESINLSSQANQLRTDTLKAIKQIKDNGIALSDKKAAALKDYNEQTKAILTQIKDTKGEIKAITEKNKANVKNKDYAAIDIAFAEIQAIQTYRNELFALLIEVLNKTNLLLTSTTAAA